MSKVKKIRQFGKKLNFQLQYERIKIMKSTFPKYIIKLKHFLSSLQLFFMNSTHFLLLLFVVVGAIAQTPSTQNEIDSFLRSTQKIPSAATITDFKETQGKFMIVYTDGPSHYKYVVKADEAGSYHIVFMEKIFSISTNIYRKGNPHQPPIKPFDKDFVEIPALLDPYGQIPLFKKSRNVQKTQRPFEIQDESFDDLLEDFEKERFGRGKRNHKMRRYENKIKEMLNEEEIEEMLLEKLPLLEGGHILSIENHGFKKGFQLTILYEKDQDKYQIEATYQPRRHRLMINKFDYAPEEPLDIGKKLINNLFSEIFEPAKPKTNKRNQIDQFLQQLIESKRLPKKRIGSEGQPERYGIPEDKTLLGSEGEPERQPIIGSQGEVERFAEEEEEEKLLLGSEGQPERNPLLGSEGEPEMPDKFVPENSKEFKEHEENVVLGSEGEPERDPLLGSEGQPEMKQTEEQTENEEEILLGSEGQPERQVQQEPSLLGSEGEPQMENKEEPLLLGSEGEPERQIEEEPSLLGSENEQEMENEEQQQSLLGSEGQPQRQIDEEETLLGSEGEPEMGNQEEPLLLGSEGEPERNIAQEEEEEEEISSVNEIEETIKR